MPDRKNRLDNQDFLDDLDELDEEQDDLSLDPGKKGIGFKKILLTFILFFFVLTAGVYAGAYFRLFNAREALDFTSISDNMVTSDNSVVTTMQPLVAFTTSIVAKLGDMMQSQIDNAAMEIASKEDETQKEQLTQQEKDLQAQEAKLNAQAEAKATQLQNQTNQNLQANNNLKNVASETDEKNKTAEDLKKIAEERQKELNKRAGRLASYYASMKPKDAVEIMKYLDNNEIIVILSRMENDVAAQILAEFEPERASVISQNILKLYPVPTVIPNSGNV